VEAEAPAGAVLDGVGGPGGGGRGGGGRGGAGLGVVEDRTGRCWTGPAAGAVEVRAAARAVLDRGRWRMGWRLGRCWTDKNCISSMDQGESSDSV
jgi:hypothetical protein